MYPTYFDLYKALQKLTPSELEQTVTIYDDMEDEFKPALFHQEKCLGFTDDTCNVLDPGHVVIFI
jgi:hypothetical protein